MDVIYSFMDEFRESFRIVDAIDILIVAAFLYAGLVWFQRTASRGILIGLALLTGIYFFAQALDMYLTSLAFQATFAVLLIILVVVFQEDLRRILERVSTLQRVSFSTADDSPDDLDPLIDAIDALAANRTGALVALQGKEPLDRHLTGGVHLDGHISRPLLESIFDSHSAGHDGAVVIEDQRITRFGAHLPISTNTQAIAGRGTRHSAALGLSERSDALVIVVSEERGVVSLAQAGTLTELRKATELRDQLDHYLESTVPATSQSPWIRLLTQHGRLKFLSLAIAVTAWFVLAYDPNTVQRTFVVPVEYVNLSPTVELDENAATEARITLTGSERDFRFLDPGSLKVSLDLTNIDVGFQEIVVAESNMRLPSNVSLYRIEPRLMRIYVLPRAPKQSADSGGN